MPGATTPEPNDPYTLWISEIAVPVGVDGAEIGRAALRQARRLRHERRTGIDELPTARQVPGLEERGRQRPVRDMRVRVCEGELHRLELRVESRRETVVERQRDERGRALAVRRQLADLHAAIVVAKRLDPFGAMAREIRPRRATRRPRSRQPRLPYRERPGPPSRSARASQRAPGSRIARPGAARERRRRGARPLVGDPRRAGRAASSRAPTPAPRAAPGRACRTAPPGRPRRARRPAPSPSAAQRRRPSGDRSPPGDRPEPFSPWRAPSCQTIANASPPIPLSVGSATVSTAAAASAASTALPPARNASNPAALASGWLVAIIASACDGGHPPPAARVRCARTEQRFEVDVHGPILARRVRPERRAMMRSVRPDADIVVVGAGIAGVATARALASVRDRSSCWSSSSSGTTEARVTARPGSSG